MTKMIKLPEITIQHADVSLANVDLLILKFAQAFFGADRKVAALIGLRGEKFTLNNWEVSIFETKGEIPAQRVAFIGTPRLVNFRYKEIRRESERLPGSGLCMGQGSPNSSYSKRG